MNSPGKYALPLLTLLLLVGVRAAYSANEPPDSKVLVHAGKATLQKVRQMPATWSKLCRMPNGIDVVIKVMRDGERQSWTFTQVVDGRTQKVCEIVESGGLWHVLEKSQALKCRPYEARLRIPAAYLLLALSDIRCIDDESQLASATFEGRQGGKVSYRMPLSPELRRALEQGISEIDRMSAENPKVLERQNVIDAVRKAREQLKGIPLIVDEKTGVLVETKLQNISVIVEEFRWLDKVPSDAFALPTAIIWDDQSQPWPTADLDHHVMAGHDPTFITGVASPSPSLDSYIVNLKSGELRRVPYPGIATMPGCFLKGRGDVVVAGFDLDGQGGLLKVNLATGKNEPITYGPFSDGMSLMAELSPDGKRLATIRVLGISASRFLDSQIQLVELESGKVQPLGNPGPVGGPFSWLPDGNGIVLKRYEPSENPLTVQPRVLCRLDLEGKLTDLRRGDWPIVLRKSRKILYQENDSKLWHTCDLDGAHPDLFAGGLKGYGTPAISPDESKIIFAQFDSAKLPQLMLFDVGKPNGKPLVSVTGFMGTPVWR